MKILLVSTGIIPVPCKYGAAIEMHTYNLANMLAEIGCDVHYVSDVTNEAKFHKRIRIYKVHSPFMKFPVSFPWWILTHLVGGVLAFRAALFALINEGFSFDVIHVHDEVVGVLFCLFARMIRRDIPLTFTLHNPIELVNQANSSIDQWTREVIFLLTGKMLIVHCDHFIALSTKIKADVTSRLRYSTKKVTVVSHGVDSDIFRPDVANVNVITTKYNIKGEYILFLSRLDKRKGADLLLTAFSHLNVNKCRCVIVGDGPERGRLVKLTKKLGISEETTFTGAVPLEDLPALYSGAEFFVLPTFAEASPMVVFEALASGLPIIITELPGVEDVIINGYNGFICHRNPEELCKYMNLLIDDDSLRNEMKINARLSVERYGWQHIAKKMIEAYECAVRDSRYD
jgi:glycosyltransferase involved in cell wall biosynthesis